MVYFLERIAKLLYDENGGDIRNHCLVFPSRRAGLYFLKYYAAQLDKPAWTPAILTINEFFRSFSDLIIADNEILLFELYKAYRKLNKASENFDEFFFWGDMLINDFDDVDKYLADASALFRNIQDFKNIDSMFGDIDQEQAEIIKRFWKNFEPEKQSPEKAGFVSIWSLLKDLYNDFKVSLRLANLAYEGMILRDVAETFMNDQEYDLKWELIHFIGFNALNKCELVVMEKLQKTGKAKFYWDYDNSYIRKGKLNSAGFFLKKNLSRLNSNMPEDWQYDTLLSSENSNVSRNIIETNSDIAQVKLLPEIIDHIPYLSPADAHHTAIILADENLIVPLLTSLPENIGDVNITMGYPLKMTGVYSFIKEILNLQSNSVSVKEKVYFRYQDIFGILKHQLIRHIITEDEIKIIEEIVSRNLIRVSEDFLSRSEILRMIFRKANDPQQLSDYLREILSFISVSNLSDNEPIGNKLTQNDIVCEFIYSALLSVNRLESIVRSPGVTFKNETYIRILDKILKNQSVPFTGEPLSGIQIMGFLETRALDFKNIIMLSVNEGILPSSTSGSSFIPLSIREAFGLPVINHKESIYAYHFYRLLHRAENITFIFNSDSTGLRTGEISRFLTQMKYELADKPVVLNLRFDIKTPAAIGSEVVKNEHHLNNLFSLYAWPGGRSLLSPTAINTWLNCRMRFYYRYVGGLKEPAAITSDIDHALFGQILHRIMKRIYTNSINSIVTSGYIASIADDRSYLLDIIDLAINETYNSDMPRSQSGSEIIIRDILLIYFLKILNADRTIAPFTVIDLEKSFHFNLLFNSNGETKTVRTGGNIDRIDNISGLTRIVDYKTGESSDRINAIDDLFDDDRKKELDGWLQTLLYCEAYLAGNTGILVRPSIYKVKALSSEDYSDVLKIKTDKGAEFILDDYQKVREAFLEGLKGTISKIFSQDEPFRMTSVSYKCGYCPYRALCQRQ